jgi:hypothetical protein
LVVGSEDGAHLAGAIGVVQRALDSIHVDAEGGGAVAGDGHLHLGVLDLQVAGDVDQPLHLMQLLLHGGGRFIQHTDVGPLQSELILTLGGAAADVDHRRIGEVDPHARHDSELLGQ